MAETDAVAVRARIKQGLFSALRSPGMILCFPTLFRPVLLAVVQEALAEAPSDWYTE